MEKIFEDLAEVIRRYYDGQKRTGDDAIKKVKLSAPVFGTEEAAHACRTILEGWISQGPNVREFESVFAHYIGLPHGIAVNSGSSANLLALLALKERYGFKDGDEVVVPAATFATVAMPVIQVGLVPVYVDVCPDTFNMDPDQVLRAISEKTKILMPVHTLGLPAEMPALMDIAARHKLAVLEDCCEAHGSSIEGRRVGSFGDIATSSFFVAHNMTTGEGGMILTRHEDLAQICRSLREFGRSEQKSADGSRYYSDAVLKDYDLRYVFERIGYNLRMTDIAAALGLEQLKKLEAMNERRCRNAFLLKEKLAGTGGNFLKFPAIKPGYYPAYYAFPMVLAEHAPFSRREFCEHLESRGIETRPLFAGCLPDQPALREAPGRIVGDLFHSRFLRDHVLFVGIHPGLEETQLDYMNDVIAAFIRQKVS